MKLFLDLKNRRFVKSAASNVALDRLVLKRRDTLPIEVIYVENGALATPPAGTTAAVGLKAKFSDATFLAYAAPGQTTLDLYTLPVEAAFSLNPATVSALLEIRWGAPGTAHRTATLQVELQNAVITGDEGTPAAIPDGKATQAEAITGTDNTKWMTPLRTAQAIAQLAPPPTWESVLNKPATFAPSSHTHLKGEITGLDADLASLASADTALGVRIVYLAANLDPAALDSIAEAAASIGTLQTQLDTKATLPTDSSHSFSQSGQSLALQPARAQFVRVTMSFANGSASVQLPSSGQNYDEVIVDANVSANCTLTVGSIELANTNQYYGIGRRLLRFVRKNNIWNLYEHPYHTHTTNELIFAAAPQVATSPGRAGTLSYAAGNLYVAVGDNQWRRVALATW